MDITEIVSEMGDIGKELDAILSGKEPEHKETKKPDNSIGREFTKQFNELNRQYDNAIEHNKLLSAENDELRRQLDAIAKASKKMLADFDRSNNELRDAKAEIRSLEKKVENLQKGQQDSTTLTRQNKAMSKALGEILGAIERCKKEL